MVLRGLRLHDSLQGSSGPRPFARERQATEETPGENIGQVAGEQEGILGESKEFSNSKWWRS
jgi:hypothetical protein